MNRDRVSSTVVGVFQDRRALEGAVEELRSAGFSKDEIGVVTHEAAGLDSGASFAPGESASGEGAATGAVTGGMVGGVLGAVAVGLIPGIGPILAAGSLGGILGGAAIGATAGGVLGGLAGMGIPEEEAQFYSDEFRAGRHLVTVRTEEHYDEASLVLSRNGAYDIRTRNAAAGEAPATDVDSGGGGHNPFVPESTAGDAEVSPGGSEAGRAGAVADEDRGREPYPR